MHEKVALAGPDIGQKEIDYVVDAVKNGWYKTYDKHIRKLEETFADYIGVKYAIATYCGTHALHLATIALNLKPGDEVIVTDQSYIATAQAISYVGATCVFVDIDPDTLCINPDKILEAITPKTRAIMLVHFAGFAADMDQIMEIAKQKNIAVIEDACQAVGVRYRETFCGSIGDIGVFSFQGSKIAVGGEGGMFVTNDESLYKRACHYGTFCRNDSIAYLWSDDVGYNYRISNVTAALILAQVERINELIEKKKKIFTWYEKNLKEIKEIKMLLPKQYCESNYSYVVGYLCDESKVKRDELIEKMIQEYNVYMRPGYPSMSLMPGYVRRFQVPNSQRYFEKGIVFPTALNIMEEDVEYVCRSLKQILLYDEK